MSLALCLKRKRALVLLRGGVLLLAGMANGVVSRGADSLPSSSSVPALAPAQPQSLTSLLEPQPQAETEAPADDGAIPQPLQGEVFDALVTNSPFTRSLGISDSLILTGVAQFQQDVYATLLDTKTMESHVVSRTANFRGWQLVGVGGNPAEIKTCLARIQVPGGEVVSIRYQKPPPRIARNLAGNSTRGGSSAPGSNGSSRPLSTAQVTEAKNAAVNYKEGFSSDGYPRQPPPEMVAKLSRLSVGQREDINRQMINLSNQGLGLPERRKIYEGLVDQAGQRR